MLIRKKFWKPFAGLALASGWGLSACLQQLLGGAAGGLARDDHREDRPERLALIGHGPVYAFQDPRDAHGSGLPLIAQVKLWKDGEELTPAYVYDTEVTGEGIYTLKTQPMRLDDLTKPAAGRPRREGFQADVERGYIRATGDSFMHAVGVKVARLLRPAKTTATCPFLVFGNERELFLLQAQASPGAAVQLASVRMGWTGFTRQQAEAIKQGLCLTPKAPVADLKAGGRYAWHTVLLGRQDAVETEVIAPLPLAAIPPTH